jgi:hypothetical protein
MEFVPPKLPSGNTPHPLEGVAVKPMAGADMPTENRGVSWSAWSILLALVLLLAGQLLLPGLMNRSPALELARVVVRPHPDVEGALRLDAVIRNPGEEASPLPLLVLGFTNRQGEPRAQRAFHPAEYLHGSEPLRLPPKSEIQVSLSLANPGSDAVNYVARIQPVSSAN